MSKKENFFEAVIVGFARSTLVAALLCITPLVGVLFGAFGGWVVGWFFSDTILGLAASLGVTGFEMWQIGAFLGFVGMFFKGGGEK